MNPAPRRRRRVGAEQGFTLLEALIALVVISIAAALLIPNLNGSLIRSRKVNLLNEASVFLQQAKQEASRRGVPVVVSIDLDEDRLFSFANVDLDPDLGFDPDSSAPSRTADYEVGRSELPVTDTDPLLDFWGPADSSPRGADITVGMSTDGSGDPVFVFEPDGSVRETGAIRFGDVRGNFFELRVEPAATARIQVLKYNPTTDFGGPNFLPRGIDEDSGENYWEWS